MAYLGSSKVFMALGDKVVAEAYLGSQHLFGVQRVSPDKSDNYNATTNRIGALGYCEYHYPCTYGRMKLGYFRGNATSQILKLWTFDDSSTYRINVDISNPSDRVILYNTKVYEGNNVVAEANFYTYWDIECYWTYEYDFANKQIKLTYPKGGSSSAPSIQIPTVTYTINYVYKPLWVDISNWSNVDTYMEPSVQAISDVQV